MKIIAESAYNHNGNLNYLKDLAIASKKSNADFFTVQVMHPEEFCTKEYSKADIYHKNSFSSEEWRSLFEFCSREGIEVIPCVLEEKSFEMCYDFGFRMFKIHGTDITNIPFLNKIKSKGDCKVILETQCSTLQDIECGLEIIGPFVEALFHGYSDYPTEIEDINLNTIKAFRRDFPNFKYGIADHSTTIKEVPLMVLSLGYDYLEKHITLTRFNRNFDWQVSLYPEEFSQMVLTINFYKKALGIDVKHPSSREMSYREIIYKKVQPFTNQLKRIDEGKDYLQSTFESFSRDKIGIALIARLKSQRLKQKVLKEFCNKTIVEDLFDRLKTVEGVSNVSLVTSTLDDDTPLVHCIGENFSFRGHPISVLDRILSFARKKELGGVFRVTGDNPLTDPYLMEKMIEIFKQDDFDYVRVNNVPFGVSAELFSSKYLWELYKKLKNPLQSEYLSWFVLNDAEAKKACINFVASDKRIPLVNLSIDYLEDYERVKKLLSRIEADSPSSIKLSDIILNLDLSDIMDENKIIKLPEGDSIMFKDYLQLMNDVDYRLKIDIYEKDIHNR